jgi:OmpA-OmpF porin, OOP family
MRPFRLGIITVALTINSIGQAIGEIRDGAAPVMVFFDWGKSEVDKQYDAALDQIVTAMGSQAGATLLVDGHSDRSGPSGANLASSRKRAEAVRDALILRGVRGDAIRVLASGENGAMITTADGVREPQNRRVDVRVELSSAR